MKIFISYRRAEDDKSYIVGSIYEPLVDAFGSENVFRDTYDIAGGTQWRSVLENALNECTVMLVIIGPDWASLANPNGEKRLFDPKDVTRWEVETGLRRSEEGKTTIIPVLVMKARIPRADELPESLKPLLERNVVNIRNHPDFNNDIEELIRDIRLTRGYQDDDITTEFFEPKTIRIEKGKFWMGSPAGEGIPSHETPQYEISLPAYRIGKYPVTNEQYEEFVRKKGKRVDPAMGWTGQKHPKNAGEYPVTGVTWKEAHEYCRWLSETTGRDYSLPNEAQWEKACRGGGNTIFPWGDEFDPTRCNHGQPGIASVKKYAAQNDYNCFDFVGNVRQWTCTLWGEDPTEPDPNYVYPWRDDGRNDLNENSQILRVVRGSSYQDDRKLLRCTARYGKLPDDRGFSGTRHGFRVVMSVK